MKRQIGLWQLVGFGVTALGGTILHFLYGWLGDAVWIAPFSAVNESTWEHMKILFWPMLIYAMIEGFFFRDKENFWCVKARGILLGISLIPVLFYTYNGVIGKSPDWINIVIFFVTAAVVYLYETVQFSHDMPCKHRGLAIAALSTLVLIFTVFTFLTPEIGIFRDPLTGSYGI